MTLLSAAGPFVLAILWTSLLGHRFARPLTGGLSAEEKIGWGVAIGFLFQAAVGLVLTLLGEKPGPIAMVACGIPFAILAGFASSGRRLPSIPFSRNVIGLAALAGIAWMIFLMQSAVEPMWANDYLAIWGFKAKTIALSPSIPPRLFHDPAAVWSHPEYPLLLPLIFASTAALAGSWNDQALALIYPVLSASIALALFGFLRRRGSAFAGAIAGLLVSLFFFLFQAFEVGMAEIPLALAVVLLATSAVDLSESLEPASAARTAVAAFLCCGLKQEGTLFVLLLSAALALRLRTAGRRPSLAIPAAAAAVLHWATLRIARGPLADRDYDLGLLSSGSPGALIGRLWTALSAVAANFAPIAIPAVAVALLLILTPRSRLDWLLPVLAAQVLAYVAICSLSSIDPVWEARFVPRISAILFPVLCGVLGDRVSRAFHEPIPGSAAC